MQTKVKNFLSTLFRIVFQGLYNDVNPKFRYTGTFPSGTIHPVNWPIKVLNVNAEINGGVFLCMYPGYYHFTAAFGAPRSNGVGVTIVHNNRDVAFGSRV